MGEIIDCRSLSQEIKNNVKERVNKLKEKGINPKLTVLTNPSDEPAKAYVRNKKRVCEEVGIEFEEIPFDKNTVCEPDGLKALYDLTYANNPVVVQLPTNREIDTENTWALIDDYCCCPERDVDGFSKDALVQPATAKGVMKIFDYINYDLEGKHICIVGRGKTCAKSLVQMLLNKNATVTVCHSYTQNLEDITSKCDVIISCVGKPHLIGFEHVGINDPVVINVGLSINPETNKLTGDVDFEDVKGFTSYITKNIGGVDLLTTACLVQNVVELYEMKEV